MRCTLSLSHHTFMTLADDELESIFYLKVAPPPRPQVTTGGRAMKELQYKCDRDDSCFISETMHFLGFNFLVVDHNRYSFW